MQRLTTIKFASAPTTLGAILCPLGYPQLSHQSPELLIASGTFMEEASFGSQAVVGEAKDSIRAEVLKI